MISVYITNMIMLFIIIQLYVFTLHFTGSFILYKNRQIRHVVSHLFEKMIKRKTASVLMTGLIINILLSFIPWQEGVDAYLYGLPCDIYYYGFPLDIPAAHHFELINLIPNQIYWFTVSYISLSILIRIHKKLITGYEDAK